MTDEQKRAAYLEWVNAHCNRSFTEEDLPGGISLALDKLVEFNNSVSPGVKSESFEGISISYGSENIPADILALIKPYRRPGF